MDRIALLYLSLIFAGITPVPAFAHTIGASETGLIFGAEPWVLFLLALSLLLYASGYLQLRQRSHGGRAQLARQAAMFAIGWLTLVIALASPLDAMGSALFSAHMLQHELLMIVAAPFLVLGRPLAIWMWALPWRGALSAAPRHPLVKLPWTFLTRPMVSWLLHAVALWAWHVPRFFEAALANEGIHAWQHASFLGSALLFWWSVLGDGSERPARAGAMLYLFSTMMHTGALGALLTWSTMAWYPVYAGTTQAYGFTLLEDQQLGGLIMWVPGGLAYVLAGLALAARWMNRVRA
jgi:putative membrane protein